MGGAISSKPCNPTEFLPACSKFSVMSADFKDGDHFGKQQLSGKFGVEGGEDASPQLSWSGFPADTKSFAITCYDPDAPTGCGFMHWAAYDIPASVTSLEAGAAGGKLPAGAKELNNDAGFPGFLGAACPPGRRHRYIFTVHALPCETLPIDEKVSPAIMGFNMFLKGVVARASIMAIFARGEQTFQIPDFFEWMPSFTPSIPCNPTEFLPACSKFSVMSADFKDGDHFGKQQLSGKFGVEGGEDASPQLSWSGFPADTKSFAITCYDPDAPTGCGFMHWAAYDIPASVTSLEAGAAGGKLPAGAKELNNDAGFPGFLGAACPPGRRHRYIFTVHALPCETLPIDEKVSPAIMGFNMFLKGVVARATMTAVFAR